jgi:HK97 gp10 family phage protein
MADITVRVHTDNHVPQVIRAVETHADNCVESIAKGIQSKAQAKAPVRTGALREGIKAESAGAHTWNVTAASTDGGADREYAEYNEYGTRKMAAQPFMKPGYEEARASDVPEAIAQYVAAIEAAGT